LIDQSVRIWQPSNVYPTATLGKDVQIGAFSEISGNAVLEDGVKVGAFCYIPGNVVVKRDAWLGPRVTICHNTFPPASPEEWAQTVVGEGAKIGGGVTIVGGVTIGKGAVIGAGSTVCKDVPDGQTWAGNPARII
jgi:acetyltransferase-like isoleucine patch superfamily enzyme